MKDTISAKEMKELKGSGMRLLTAQEEQAGKAQGWVEVGKWTGNEAIEMFAEAQSFLRAAASEWDTLVLCKPDEESPTCYLYHDGQEPRLLAYYSDDGSADDALEALFEKLLPALGIDEVEVAVNVHAG